MKLVKQSHTMKIQFNTDKNISGAERNEAFFTTKISNELQRFEKEMTRIEVHISDENSHKEGQNDIRCLIEARLEGKQPIAVSAQEDTIELAVFSALEKLTTVLTTNLGREKNY